MVVPVLITSCQVSLKLKKEPVRAQSKIIDTADVKVIGCPAADEVHLANREKRDVLLTKFLCLLDG